ncbi:MAG: hypothetical protein K8R40_00395 [Anaerolineaceae bacterium]|nr:hypothetical protein [Anaerolineaceae bacterium]
MRRTFKVVFISLLAVIFISACSLPGLGNQNGGSGVATPDLVNTAAAQTIEVVKTELAKEATAPVQPTLAPTWTSEVDDVLETETAATEAAEEITPLPTNSPMPTWTPIPAATNTPEPVCNEMQFIKDVTIPDGTWMQPNQTFTKIWEVKNVGACTWDAGYAVVFGDEGNAMGAPVSQGISDAPIEPGETLKIAINFTAPSSDGLYKGVWRLRSTSSNEFGRFTVNINADGNPDEFIFTNYACSAEYSNTAGILPCPSDKKGNIGYAYVTDKPIFETGYQDDEDALIMVPRDIENGKLSAEFFMNRMPSASAHFKTIIGCTADHPSCDTIMRVYYQIDGDATRHMIGEWDEKYDDAVNPIDIDLTPFGLENKLVRFTLEVHADGQPDDDEVFWFLPRIVVP